MCSKYEWEQSGFIDEPDTIQGMLKVSVSMVSSGSVVDASSGNDAGG
jgi:hypothetical protein